MRTTRLIASALMLTTQLLYSQFVKVYKSSPYDQEGQDVVQMSDGQFLIVGYTGTSVLHNTDVLIILADWNGEKVWSKTIGGASTDFCNRLLKSFDGNFYLAGFSQSYGGGDEDMFIIKLDGSGNEVWKKTYGSNRNERATDIIDSDDGNLVIVGSAKTAGGDYNAVLRKITRGGDEVWVREFGGNADDFGNCVKLANDGGYVLLGQTYSKGAGQGDAFLVKTNSAGTESWNKTYGQPLSDEGIYINANSDGSYIFLVRDSSAAKDIDIKVIKTDATGEIIWAKQYGGTDKDTPKMIQPTADGGYVMCGNSRSFGWINPEMWILKLTASGDTTWTRHYGGFGNEHCYTVRQVNDWTYIGVGKTHNSYGPDFDPIFIMLNSEGTLTVGLDEKPDARGITAFPIGIGRIIVKCSEDQRYDLRVNSIDGRLISQLHGLQGESETTVTTSAPGVYVIHIQCAPGQSFRRKVILTE